MNFLQIRVEENSILNETIAFEPTKSKPLRKQITSLKLQDVCSHACVL